MWTLRCKRNKDNNMPMNELNERDDGNLLVSVRALWTETEAETDRIKKAQYAGELTPAQAAQELAETCMPLMRDLAQRLFDVQNHAILFRQAASPEIWPDGDTDSVGIWTEDAAMFKQLISDYRDILTRSLDGVDGAAKAEHSKQITLATRALKRLDELTIQDEDEDEPEEDEDEAETDAEDSDDEDEEDKPS